MPYAEPLTVLEPGPRHVEASGMMRPVCEDALPNVPDDELAEAAVRVAPAM